MGSVEFLTMAYALACTLGPAMGVLLSIAYLVLNKINQTGFSVTIALPAEDKHDGK